MTPSRTNLTGGICSPSAKIEVLNGLTELGTRPPISEQCTNAQPYATISPSTKYGSIICTSGR